MSLFNFNVPNQTANLWFTTLVTRDLYPLHVSCRQIASPAAATRMAVSPAEKAAISLLEGKSVGEDDDSSCVLRQFRRFSKLGASKTIGFPFSAQR